jgi:UDP-3-O-[3-hydroxymyristoyl] glucosamine N-acyltransferase
MEFSAQDIANVLNGVIDGNSDVKVNSFSKIEEGMSGTLSFLANPKYEHHIYETNASIVLVNKDFIPSKPVKATLIKVENAYSALAVLLNIVEQSKTKKAGVSSTAYIAKSAVIGEGSYVGEFAYIGENSKIGKDCKIYPYAYVGEHVIIGDNTTIYPHTTIYSDCTVGKNCIFHAGSVLGADGFGFAPEGDLYKKIPQLGNVIVGDDVEIGANTTIDRAVMGSTIIHNGVKLDNLVQIAHNVEIGENTVMAAQVGIAGSVKVGKHCMFGGQVGLAGHIKIADNVVFGAQSGVISDVKEGQKVLGAPAMDSKNFMRSSMLFAKLPEIYRTIGELQREVEQLKKERNQ